MTALSGWITRGLLIHEAGRQVASLRQGEPLWQWRLHRASDLVASRVFGAADLAAVHDGLKITSRDGTPFEIGLPLSAPIDLKHWPLLRIDMQPGHAGSLGLIYQPYESVPPCSDERAATLAPNTAHSVLDLRTLSWRNPQGSSCDAPEVDAYLLRLRITVPAGTSLIVRSAAAARAEAISFTTAIDGVAADLTLPLSTAPSHWEPSPQELSQFQVPLVRLPADISPEAMLLWRDRIHQYWPAAIVLPHGAALTATGTTQVTAWLDVGACGIYLAWLAWLTWRQRPGVIRPWTEVTAIAIGPLWLIAGLRWGPEPSIPGIAAFVAALVYGGQSEWRRRPVEWSWWARRGSDWLYPMLPLPVAAALMLADGHPLLHLEYRHILAYLGWALLQQWAMLALVMGRLERTGLPRSGVILLTATLFGLLHTPNGSLMQLCLLAELWWAWSFMRSPRLLPIALAHAASALLVEAGLTGHLLRSLEVSARFFL